MNRNVIIALVLIALSVIVLIFNTQKVDLALIFAVYHWTASLVYLGFLALGVIIGILLK